MSTTAAERAQITAERYAVAVCRLRLDLSGQLLRLKSDQPGLAERFGQAMADRAWADRSLHWCESPTLGELRREAQAYGAHQTLAGMRRRQATA